jgi:hypothetical protein
MTELGIIAAVICFGLCVYGISAAIRRSRRHEQGVAAR